MNFSGKLDNSKPEKDLSGDAGGKSVAMACIFRISVVRLAGTPTLLKSATPAAVQQCRTIAGRTLRGSLPRTPKPAPWPYKTRKYNIFWSLIDRTTNRIDENSKIIVVDGPIACGKSKFCEELAKELEMIYVPEPTMDRIYINSYGYDLRQLDPKLPEVCRSFDEKKFALDPKNPGVTNFQIEKYQMRFVDYIDALDHLLNTGQGVVMERSVYSDFVFTETMFKHGFLSKVAHRLYNEIQNATIGELMKPHLVIYLDVSPQKTLENIRKRGLAHEVKSPAYNEAYLTDMDYFYKQKYLQEIGVYSEVLIYDWSEGGDTEVVVEDIERIDFDKWYDYDYDYPKLQDWRLRHNELWNAKRIKYADKDDIMGLFHTVVSLDCPEVLVGAGENEEYEKVIASAPGGQFAPGFNADMGDKNILLKTK